MTKGERIAREKFLRHVWMAEQDNPDWGRVERQVPEAWHMIAHDLDVFEKKEKLTLYLDGSVAKLFRAMGPGYQARINRILATWAHAEMAGLLQFRETFRKRMGEMVE